MDYRILLAAPLAAAAMSASSADTLRQPDGWLAMASYGWPQGPTHEAGVAPETEHSGQRALTVRALGEAKPHEIGSISQYVFGYAGKRLRLSGQVKTAGTNAWAGLVIGQGYQPLPYTHFSPAASTAPAVGSAGCPDWCDVSVVVDVPTTGDDAGIGVANVGLALVGKGQVWARGLRVDAVGPEVPVSTQAFAPQAAATAQGHMQQSRQQRMAEKSTPRNLALR